MSSQIIGMLVMVVAFAAVIAGASYVFALTTEEREPTKTPRSTTSLR